MSLKTKYFLGTVGVCLLAASGWALAQGAKPHSDPPAENQSPAGVKIFGKWCGDCHSTAGGSGAQALQRKYHGDIPAILEQRSDLHPDYVRQVVRRGISFMPSFRKTEISDAELALVAAYLAPSSGQADRVTKRP